MPATLTVVKANWLLKDVMERYRITNKELGEKLNRHSQAISRLKKPNELPALGSSEIAKIANAINELLHERNLSDRISMRDLIGFED